MAVTSLPGILTCCIIGYADVRQPALCAALCACEADKREDVRNARCGCYQLAMIVVGGYYLTVLPSTSPDGIGKPERMGHPSVHDICERPGSNSLRLVATSQ